MKILITYSSKTSNTKKVAYAIKEALPNSTILPVCEVEDLDYDIIFIGGWIDKATFDSKALKFVERLSNKRVAYFYTLGANPNSNHAKDCTKNIEQLLKTNNNIVVDGYFCQGAIDPKLIEKLLLLPKDHKMYPTNERKQRWDDAKSHPNEDDLIGAKNFAKDVLTKI